jgi:hypothetical protein
MYRKYHLGEMLAYKRPDGSRHQKKFCNRYLRPVMEGPDLFGNYIKIIGDKPNVAFMAHHDTVHRDSGKQEVIKEGNFYKVPQFGTSNCLGADCTTGVYIILRMIEAGIPGVYVVHGAEEIGCIGSRGMVASKPDWINHVDAAISFDRKGYSSIITHQLGERTCSDAFGESLANILDMDYGLDDSGVYTDSNEYREVIAECTNISVGYFLQHTKSETQDINFVELLVDQLIKADWSALVIKRDPSVVEFDGWEKYYGTSTYSEGGFKSYYSSPKSTHKPQGEKIIHPENKDMDDMIELIQNNPIQVARLLKDIGYDAYDLIDEVYNYKKNPGFEEDDYEF